MRHVPQLVEGVPTLAADRRAGRGRSPPRGSSCSARAIAPHLPTARPPGALPTRPARLAAVAGPASSACRSGERPGSAITNGRAARSSAKPIRSASWLILGQRRLVGVDPRAAARRRRSPLRSLPSPVPPTRSPRSRCARRDRRIRTAGRPIRVARAARLRWRPPASPATRTGRRAGNWPGSRPAGSPRARGRAHARGTHRSSCLARRLALDRASGSRGRGSSGPTRARPRAADATAEMRAVPRSCRGPVRQKSSRSARSTILRSASPRASQRHRGSMCNCTVDVRQKRAGSRIAVVRAMGSFPAGWLRDGFWQAAVATFAVLVLGAGPAGGESPDDLQPGGRGAELLDHPAAPDDLRHAALPGAARRPTAPSDRRRRSPRRPPIRGGSSPTICAGTSATAAPATSA